MKKALAPAGGDPGRRAAGPDDLLRARPRKPEAGRGEAVEKGSALFFGRPDSSKWAAFAVRAEDDRVGRGGKTPKLDILPAGFYPCP